jgi:hypothetical protein
LDSCDILKQRTEHFLRNSDYVHLFNCIFVDGRMLCVGRWATMYELLIDVRL